MEKRRGNSVLAGYRGSVVLYKKPADLAAPKIIENDPIDENPIISNYFKSLKTKVNKTRRFSLNLAL